MFTLVLPEQPLQERAEFTATTLCACGCRRVLVTGELDAASRDLVYQECITGGNIVTVEMDRLTFMDCSGYGGLMAARQELVRRGGSLTLRGAVGQPAKVLALISACEVSIQS